MNADDGFPSLSHLKIYQERVNLAVARSVGKIVANGRHLLFEDCLEDFASNRLLPDESDRFKSVPWYNFFNRCTDGAVPVIRDLWCLEELV